MAGQMQPFQMPGCVGEEDLREDVQDSAWRMRGKKEDLFSSPFPVCASEKTVFSLRTSYQYFLNYDMLMFVGDVPPQWVYLLLFVNVFFFH
jgi:hypothetical protein